MKVLVTYLREDLPGQATVREGEGDTLAEAVGLADRRLPEGDWRRSGISTVGGTIRSLRADRRRRDSRLARELEGQLIRVRFLLVDE